MKYNINLKNIETKKIYNLSEKFSGKNPEGEEITFTNYFMKVNDKPFYGVSGEFHFSRCDDQYWENEIIKMKMCGINVISTYIFWIHHEEIEGEFNFEGRRNLRKFIELCCKHDIYVIVRIGPFDHGEVRNGGLPDWLYGKPFEVRAMNEGFLSYTKKFYTTLAKEMTGQYYKDGGPIIAAQIDNEYMHSSAPWEITTGIANEWLPAGSEGNTYMLALKELAVEVGIDVPFYTCTGWGGAATPIEEMMPLWGGYAFWPWIFYSHKGEHPATPEYIYRDNHNSKVTKTYNFEPMYKPEEMPYACCEMGGGMMCSYNYRFKLDYQSVDAMANVKMASGCNFLGYYVFKGGTNPTGKTSKYLNEGQVPKLSYDYQAALGEYGQIRESYRRLKPLHMFAEAFKEELCVTKTVLPEGSQDIAPTDTKTLRYAVRVADNKGFIFINNYQDHAVAEAKKNCSITLELEHEEIVISDLSIEKDENCILPFNLELGNVLLKYATVQPVTYLEAEGKKYYFFMKIEGMKPKYVLNKENITSINAVNKETQADHYIILPNEEEISSFEVEAQDKTIIIVTLSRKISLELYKANIEGQETMMITRGALLVDRGSIRVETEDDAFSVYSFPEIRYNDEGAIKCLAPKDIFTGISIKVMQKVIIPKLKQVGPTRYTIEIPSDTLENIKEALLQINYIGDIGQAFIDGDMIADNFCNGDIWEIGLSEFKERLKENPITIYITPIKEGVNVKVDSTMAARIEEIDGIIGRIDAIKIKSVNEITLL